MPTYEVSRGESFTISSQDRAYGGKTVTTFKVDGGNVANPVTGLAATTLGQIDMNGTILVNGSPAASLATLATKQLILTGAGLGAPGSVAVAGTIVGDKVLAVVNLTTPGTVTASFEGTVSVAAAVQQTATTGISAGNVLLFIIAHQA